MGAGTKEKVERLAAENQFSAELLGVRTLALLLFATMILFSLSLATTVSLSLESPAQQAALFSKLAKEKTERAERLKKRYHDQLTEATSNIKEATDLSNMKKRESSTEEIPAWVTSRISKKKSKKKSAEEDALDEFGLEDAELEVRTFMGEWMREAAQSRAATIVPISESSSLVTLRKRQEFVENGLDAVTAHDDLDDFDLELLTSDKPNDALKLEAAVAEQEKQETQEKPYLGLSGNNPQLKTIRTSNFFLTSASKADKEFLAHLQLLGYSASTSSTLTGKNLPLWIIAYGTKCPEVEYTERHILICPKYLPSLAASAHYLPSHFAVRSSKFVMQEVLTRSKHKRSDGAALSAALAEVYNARNFAHESFRLFKDKAKLESHLARESERRPIFILSQNDGTTQPQLTDNVLTILQKGEAKYASKQLVLRRYNLSPILWQEKKFVFRNQVVIFHSNPLQVLYYESGILRAKDDFVKPVTGSVEDAPISVHFPGVSTVSERFTLKQFQKATGRDLTYFQSRMKQIAAYAILSYGVPLTKLIEGDRTIAVQHVCFDFSLENVEDDEEEEVYLEHVRKDCPIEENNRNLVDWVNVLSEEILLKKSHSEPFSFSSLPSFEHSKFQILFDEMKENEEDRSLLDVLESLVPAVKRPKRVSSASSNSFDRQQDGVITCEEPNSLISKSTHTFSSFSTTFPVCSFDDMESLFSTVAAVLSNEPVDEETFFNARIESGIRMSLQNFMDGLFKLSLQEARLAGYSPCIRMKKHVVSIFFVAVSKGLSPFAVQSFSCKGASSPTSRRLFIEIPHPFFDHTRKEGLELFERGTARSLLISGTHRCAIAPPSFCTGSIGKSVRTNCGGREDYQNGDVAHSVENSFWVVHTFLTSAFKDDLVLSLHSTKQESFIISDGTSWDVQRTSPVAKIALGLSKSFKNILCCNDFESSPNIRQLSDTERDVCGATNVQGRHLNGAADPCHAKVHENGSPLVSSGRFVHIEQPVHLVKQEQALEELLKGMELALRELDEVED